MKCYDKGPGEKTVLMAVREALPQPLEATNWTDLRIGFFVSLVGDVDGVDDNTITTLQEDIGADDRVPIQWTDRLSIGCVGGGFEPDATFFGYTNAATGRTGQSFGRSRLLSSDIGVGTANSDYWRATNGRGDKYTAQIIQTGITRASSDVGSQPHFVQNYTVGHAAGYAACHALRFTRPDARGRKNIITMYVPKAASGDNSSYFFSSTPSKALLEAQLETFPTSVQVLGPVEVAHAPDSLWWYWPFHQSRLRIHARGLVKVA